MTYFHDLWTLPSPSASMEGTGHPGMAMPLSTAEVVYNIVQQASTDPDLTPAQELDPVSRAYLGSRFSCHYRSFRPSLSL
jgi:hypothetical protein